MVSRIALRYLFAPKSHRAVNVISMVAMAGVAVAAMAIVVVLSVFNGFTDLARHNLARLDPEVLVRPADGSKVFAADSLADILGARPDVAAATATLSGRALLIGDDGMQMPVRVKSFDYDRLPAVTPLADLIIDGDLSAASPLYDGTAGFQASVGVAMRTGLRPSPYTTATLYAPRRLGRINPANPAAAYRQMPLSLTGVFQVDQAEYDADYIFMPLAAFRELLEYPDGTGSAVELRAADGVRPASLVKTLAHEYPQYEFLGRDRQQADTFRMISVEKWVTFLMLVFILIVAAFNIISTISLLAIEKRSDLVTLRALGAPRSMILSIFISLGRLITTAGGVAGIVVGVVLALLQEHFGLVKLDGDPAAMTIDVYPVRVEWLDILYVFAAIVLTGWVIGCISQLFTKNIDTNHDN